MLMWIGSVTAVLSGALVPSLCILTGEIIQAFSPENTLDEILYLIRKISAITAAIGIIE